jgi:hypothetical protein
MQKPWQFAMLGIPFWIVISLSSAYNDTSPLLDLAPPVATTRDGPPMPPAGLNLPTIWDYTTGPVSDKFLAALSGHVTHDGASGSDCVCEGLTSSWTPATSDSALPSISGEQYERLCGVQLHSVHVRALICP